MPSRYSGAAAVRSKTAGNNRLAGKYQFRISTFMATAPLPTRDDFAALLDQTFGKDEAFEGKVVKGTITAI